MKSDSGRQRRHSLRAPAAALGSMGGGPAEAAASLAAAVAAPAAAPAQEAEESAAGGGAGVGVTEGWALLSANSAGFASLQSLEEVPTGETEIRGERHDRQGKQQQAIREQE